MHTDTTTRRVYVPVTQIIEGSRVRADYGDLKDLAQSISDHGLIHPIVVDLNYNLVAGGRRLRATRDVLKQNDIAITFIEVADDATLRRLEAEENVRRKEMTWQERVRSVRLVHQHQALKAALTGTAWTQTMTGELLGRGYSQGSVSLTLLIAALLDKNDKEINDCENFTEALKVCLKRKEDEANAAIAKATIGPGSGQSNRTSDILSTVDGDSFFATGQSAPNGPTVDLAQRPSIPELPGDVKLEPFTVPLSSMLHRADAIEWLKAQSAESFDHCITDPPYAIDMGMIQQDGGGMDVSSTSVEHDVIPNIKLLQDFVVEAYRVLKDKSFLVVWCDYDMWDLLTGCALDVGFKVQRWPLSWIKTHPCQNMAAQYNFTKNVEIAMVCRKGNATLVTPQTSCYWQGSITNEKETLGHPFTKPKALWTWLYSAVAIRGQRVLDPFAGSGSSIIAAITAGLSPTAVECNEAHYNRLVVNVSNQYRQMNPNTQFV